MSFKMRSVSSKFNKYLGVLSVTCLLAATFLLGKTALTFHNDSNSFGIAYKIYAAKICFALFILTALMGVFRRFTAKFAVLPLILVTSGVAALLIGKFTITDAMWRYQYVGDVGYSVPRIYAVDMDYGPPGWGIRAVYCAKDLSGSRLRQNEGCERTYLHLSHPSSPHYVMVDPPKDLSCVEYTDGLECRVTTNTELGQLSYEVGSRSITPAFAEAYEKRLIDLLKSWRIEGGT